MTEKEREMTINIFRKQIDFLVLPERFAERIREFIGMLDTIKNVLSGSPKTAEEIAKEINADVTNVSWYLMTFQKYGYIKIVGKDDEGRYKFIWSEELMFG